MFQTVFRIFRPKNPVLRVHARAGCAISAIKAKAPGSRSRLRAQLDVTIHNVLRAGRLIKLALEVWNMFFAIVPNFVPNCDRMPKRNRL
jgi:hypothetical protein